MQSGLVSDVRDWFKLEGGVLNVEVSREAHLQCVENLWGMAAVKAVVFDHDVRGECQRPRGNSPRRGGRGTSRNVRHPR